MDVTMDIGLTAFQAGSLQRLPEEAGPEAIKDSAFQNLKLDTLNI